MESFTHTAYAWGTEAVVHPRDFHVPELQNKFKITQMKGHLSTVYIGNKKGGSLPLNSCSHTSACKKQDIFKAHFHLCSVILITWYVLCNIWFIYFIVFPCQIVLSSTGWKKMKVLTALANSAWCLNTSVLSVTTLSCTSPAKRGDPNFLHCLLLYLHELLDWNKNR